MSDPRTDRGAESASLIGVKASAEMARLRTVIATLVRMGIDVDEPFERRHEDFDISLERIRRLLVQIGDQSVDLAPDRGAQHHVPGLTDTAGLVPDGWKGPYPWPGSRRRRRAGRRVGKRMRRWVLLLVAVMAVGLVGCDKPRVIPIGDAPLRYRDEVFSQTETTKNIQYGSALDQFGVTQTLLLDVLTPTGDTVTARPAIVWVHGGSFKSGDKSATQIVNEATKFAKLGYVGASINYRLYPSGCTTNYQLATCVQEMTDAQHDAQAAVRFLRANAATYGIDPARIAIKGVSAGAITALNVGFNPDDPGNSGNPEFPSTVRAAVSISGAKKLGTADAGDASSLLLHGTADTVVPYQWAVDTYNEATAAQLTTYLTSFDGAGHAPYSDYGTEMFEQTRNFLYWEMDLPAAAH